MAKSKETAVANGKAKKAEENGKAEPTNRIEEYVPMSTTVSAARIKVVLKGLLPGLLYQGKGVMLADLQTPGGSKTRRPRPASEEADLRCHYKGTGSQRKPAIPWVMLYNSFCAAAGAFSFKGQKTLSTIVAGTIACEQAPKIELIGPPYEVYEDFCRIPPRKGAMVLIGRPLFKEWAAEFVLVVDDEMYDAMRLRDVLIYAGKMIGIGAWRPQLKGPHGRFAVEEFEVLEK